MQTSDKRTGNLRETEGQFYQELCGITTMWECLIVGIPSLKSLRWQCKKLPSFLNLKL